MVGGALHCAPVVNGVGERFVKSIAVRSVERHDHRGVGAGLPAKEPAEALQEVLERPPG